MKGPYAIICRGHSGSRLLCEAFRQNRMWMGKCNNEQRDSLEFGAHERVVRDLIRYGFQYPDMTETERRAVQDIMVTVVEGSKRNCPNPHDMVAFGWKRPVTTFMCEIFLDAYADAKTVHLIRDGRDAMLSRLDARMNRLNKPLNRLIVFGDTNVNSYRGRALDQATVDAYRNELEMHHWVTAVGFGMRGRRYTDRYLEIRYEDLCRYPEKTMQKVFEFLDVPFSQESREWIIANASPRSIGKWKGREEELSDAIRVGEPLLKELGYI